jgi:GrpB-like predicted nucleotidyltransferase (UPF0157 family)
VQVYRFDQDIAKTLTNRDSRIKIGELVGDARLERAGILYFDTGQRLSLQESEDQQIFAVISGACIVESENLSSFVLRSGQAIAVSAREQWAVSPTQPVVAFLAEGTFDVWAVAVTKEIAVVSYDESWPTSFDEICHAIWPYVESVARRIDHIGSTAVHGLDAKPVIDIDIVVAGENDVTPAIDRLGSAGYRWRGDLGVVGREAFDPPKETELPEHHLYVVVDGNRAHLDHVLLRDLLRADEKARIEYAQLKAANAAAAEGNMDVYVKAKAAFVAELLTRARFERGLPPVSYWVPEE